MKKIYVPTKCFSDWKRLLADPDKQWKKGFSARTLALAWEEAGGFPVRIRKCLSRVFKDVEPLLIIPEHKVTLPGGSKASQNDIWILARANREIISITVEGKVDEPFGPTIKKWNPLSLSGRKQRLDFIEQKLQLNGIPDNTRYQLCHRAVSAIIEAENFKASHAVMIVHSFSKKNLHFDDYSNFLKLFDINAERGELHSIRLSDAMMLHFGWVKGEPKYLKM